jgi:spermidine/putrescine transport system permease protein
MIRRHGLEALYWAAVAALGLPLCLIALASLSAGAMVGFPLGALSLRWYEAALGDPAFLRAFVLSVALAAGSAGLAVAAGTAIALGTATLTSPWMRVAVLAGAVMPLVTPGIVHAVALRIAMQAIGLGPGPLAILLGHAIHATPYAAIIAGARRASLPPDLIAAARDLGAGPVAAFVHVVVPWLRPALLGAGALAALTSFDDFIRSFFLGGYEPTLPVLVFGRLRSGLTPQVNAIATLVLIATASLGLLAERVARRRDAM